MGENAIILAKIREWEIEGVISSSLARQLAGNVPEEADSPGEVDEAGEYWPSEEEYYRRIIGTGPVTFPGRAGRPRDNAGCAVRFRAGFADRDDDIVTAIAYYMERRVNTYADCARLLHALIECHVIARPGSIIAAARYFAVLAPWGLRWWRETGEYGQDREAEEKAAKAIQKAFTEMQDETAGMREELEAIWDEVRRNLPGL